MICEVEEEVGMGKSSCYLVSCTLAMLHKMSDLEIFEQACEDIYGDLVQHYSRIHPPSARAACALFVQAGPGIQHGA